MHQQTDCVRTVIGSMDFKVRKIANQTQQNANALDHKYKLRHAAENFF